MELIQTADFGCSTLCFTARNIRGSIMLSTLILAISFMFSGNSWVMPFMPNSKEGRRKVKRPCSNQFRA